MCRKWPVPIATGRAKSRKLSKAQFSPLRTDSSFFVCPPSQEPGWRPHNSHFLARRFGFVQLPMWILERLWNSPKTFRSHNTTTITTTAFKMDLIVPCIGIKRLTSQSRRPTTTRTITTCSKGIWQSPSLRGQTACSAMLRHWAYLPDLFLGDLLLRVETSNFPDAGTRTALLITMSFAVTPFP